MGEPRADTERNNGLRLWRAGCVETGTSGSEGGLENRPRVTPERRPCPTLRLREDQDRFRLRGVRDRRVLETHRWLAGDA